ncbi:hypothetical protein COL26b_013701 [Colletotrichum chrysophilum]|uniref:uncharacterized protein n=1 Tax=Colletotrichum chrysophilum TaxID=1836956 RepID=UPI0023008175|nr:uncharacterized protein COL26b_013701 [Colletotrichum chrysophilum]KAJ0361464.1 hypothetical protein COL26b_013701 [Colletotrichum chrysophilum]
MDHRDSTMWLVLLLTPAWRREIPQLAQPSQPNQDGLQGEGRLGEPTPALCHTGAGVNMVISEDKNAEVEVETIIKTV